MKKYVEGLTKERHLAPHVSLVALRLLHFLHVRLRFLLIFAAALLRDAVKSVHDVTCHITSIATRREDNYEICTNRAHLPAHVDMRTIFQHLPCALTLLPEFVLHIAFLLRLARVGDMQLHGTTVDARYRCEKRSTYL